MEHPELLAGSLAFSAIALPVIMNLYTKNNKQEIKINCDKVRSEYKEELHKLSNELNHKIDELISHIHHKKMAIENLDRISNKLLKISENLGHERIL